MSFRLGLVGLCTSHPESWVPIIRALQKEGLADVEVTACWDSAETRLAGFAKEFATKLSIPKAVDRLEDMLGEVDGVIVHTTNWDKHLEQARPFVDANKPVLLDKPIVGNMKDINQLLDWVKQGKKITGGSSLRFTTAGAAFLAQPVAERGDVHTVFGGCGVDEYNYGIHAYSFACQVLGPGVQSAQCLGGTRQKHIKITWQTGQVAILAVGTVDKWLPFHLTAITNKNVAQLKPEGGSLYQADMSMIADGHTGIEHAYGHHFADEEKKLARRIVDLFEHDGILLTKMNEGAHHVSVNPRRLREVGEIVSGTWARAGELDRL